MTYNSMLDMMALKNPNRTAVMDKRESYTYKELRDKVCEMAAYLTGLGLKPGDKAALIGADSARFLIAYFAVIKAGGISVGIKFDASIEKNAFMLKLSDAEFLLFGRFSDSNDGEEAVRKIIEKSGVTIDHLINIDETETPGFDCVGKQSDAGDVTVADCAAEQFGTGDGTGADFAAFTSGSSSAPKMVLTSQNTELHAAENFNRIVGSRENRTAFIGHHLYHILGLQSCMYYLSVGGAVYLSEDCSAEDVRTLIENCGEIDLVGMSGFYNRITNDPCFAQSIAPYVNTCISAGGITPMTIVRLEDKFDHAIFINMYGLTEAAPIAINSPDDNLHTRSHAAGHIVSGVEVKIVDETGRECDRNEIGEVLVKGPVLMKGYYKRDDSPIDSDGYLHTEDIGYTDSEGKLFIMGRLSEVTWKEDHRIIPEEIAAVLEKDDNLREVKVLKMPHPVYGETIVACVIPADMDSFDKRETYKRLLEELPFEKVPSYVFPMEEFPKLSGGKLDFRNMAENIRTVYTDCIIEEGCQKGIEIFEIKLKDSPLSIPPVMAFMGKLVDTLGFEEAKKNSILTLTREVIRDRIMGNYYRLGELKLTVVMLERMLELRFEDTGNRFALRNNARPAIDVSEILDNAADYRFRINEDNSYYYAFDYVFDRDDIALDYLNWN